VSEFKPTHEHLCQYVLDASDHNSNATLQRSRKAYASAHQERLALTAHCGNVPVYICLKLLRAIADGSSLYPVAHLVFSSLIGDS
jgi:hypothetical protein